MGAPSLGPAGAAFIEGGTQRFWQQFYTMVPLYRCPHVRGVGPLTASFFELALLAELFHKQLEEALLCSMLDQPCTECGEHPAIEAWVGQFQAQQIFAVQAGSYGICCLTIGKIFHILHKADQPQSPRSCCWFPSGWEQISKLAILKNCP